MLYYDATHLDEDKESRPYRLLPTFPHLKIPIMITAFIFFILAGGLVFTIDPLKGALMFLIGLILMPFYSIFKKKVIHWGKYFVRGIGGFLLVMIAPFVFATATIGLILTGLAIFFLDIAGNIAGDLRDWKRDGSNSIINRLGLRKAWLIQSGCITVNLLMLVSVLLLVNTNLIIVTFYLIISAFLAGLILLVKTTHKAHILYKTILIASFVSIISSTVIIFLIGLALLPAIYFAYNLSHPKKS